MYVGSPETVAGKIAKTEVVDAKRFDMVYGFGPMKAEARRHDRTLRSGSYSTRSWCWQKSRLS